MSATFSVLQPRAVDEEPDPLYPNPLREANTFATEPHDGTRVRRFAAHAVIGKVGSGDRAVDTARAENVKAVVALTESRLVVACTEFRTGGGWSGWGLAGAATAIAANAVSKAIATRGTKGFSLVGHVRFEWLRAVVAQDYKWKRSQNVLKLVFLDPAGSGRVCSMIVYLENRDPSEGIAQQLVERACAAQAQATDDADLRVRLERFGAQRPSTPLKSGHGRSWELPT